MKPRVDANVAGNDLVGRIVEHLEDLGNGKLTIAVEIHLSFYALENLKIVI
jgi:hypothetical protein